MLANMTNVITYCIMQFQTHFSVFHIEFLIPMTPQFFFYYGGVQASTEILITRICAGFVFCEFYLIVLLLSLQYTKFANINFFTIKDQTPGEDSKKK